MLKSLYFKLNPENEKHQYIIDFFDKSQIPKVDLLYYMVRMYRIRDVFKNGTTNAVGCIDNTKNNKKG